MLEVSKNSPVASLNNSSGKTVEQQVRRIKVENLKQTSKLHKKLKSETKVFQEQEEIKDVELVYTQELQAVVLLYAAS